MKAAVRHSFPKTRRNRPRRWASLWSSLVARPRVSVSVVATASEAQIAIPARRLPARIDMAPMPRSAATNRTATVRSCPVKATPAAT